MMTLFGLEADCNLGTATDGRHPDIVAGSIRFWTDGSNIHPATGFGPDAGYIRLNPGLLSEFG